MTPETAKKIAAALNTRPFENAHRSTDTLNAQAALEGITHYCDASTLRYHKARIVGACVVSYGAFFKITETCAADYQNTRRGYRVALFDLTGEVVYRPKLEEMQSTKDKANKQFWAWFNEFNESEHYRAKFNRKADSLARQIVELNEAANFLISNEVQA